MWLTLLVALVLLGRRRDAKELARFIPDCIVLFKRLLLDSRLPSGPKLAVALLLPYLVFPLDLVPDFIPVLGQLDDAILVAAVLAYVARTAGKDVIAEHWAGSERALALVLRITNAR